MNFRLLSKILGLVLLLLSGMMALCLAFAIGAAYVGRRIGDASWAFFLSIAISFGVGGILFLLGRRAGREMLRKEGIAIVGLGWLVCGLFGALPFLFSDSGFSPSEAVFESISGFTTTGATVITDLDEIPRSLILWRALTQWLGGLGILVLFVALLASLGVGSKALFRHESSAKSGQGVQTRIHEVAVRLWLIYGGLSLLCCLGLIVLGTSVFDAICHTFTAISTGGFSPYNESIAAFESLGVELWLTLFMMLGGISFMFYAWLLRGRFERWRREEEVKAFLLLLLGCSLIVAVDLVLLKQDRSFAQAFRDSVFQVVSIMTTTGYVTADFDQWPAFSRVVLLLLMGIGGCAGSTAGGIKVSRWLLFFKITRLEILTAFRPNQVVAIHLNRNLVGDSLKIQTVFFVALAGVTVFIGTALVSLLQPHLGIISCFSSVVSTLFNIGPGFGAVGPTRTFAGFRPATQLLLSFFMILGRLEFFAVLVLFMPSLWRKY